MVIFSNKCSYNYINKKSDYKIKQIFQILNYFQNSIKFGHTDLIFKEISVLKSKKICIFSRFNISSYLNLLSLWFNPVFNRAFHGFGQAEFDYGGLLLGSSQYCPSYL